MRKTVRIKAYYPNYFGDDLIAYVSLRIVNCFNDKRVRADIMGICSEKSVANFKHLNQRKSAFDDGRPVLRRIYRDAIPPGIIWAMVRRLFNTSQINVFAERRFFLTLRKGDIIYLWPGASLKLYQKLHTSGFTIVSERINTLLSTSKRILDEEYCRLGIHPSHGLTIHAMHDELSCMKIADYIFSPSPSVTTSILEAGIPQTKIINTSYGLEAHEIFSAPGSSDLDKPVTAIFVGTICVRKGIHLLLEAWIKADVTARLLIVGRIAPEAEAILDAALKARSDMERIDFVEDLKPIYRKADFMILPSLEEGSPLVTYLALGASLPVVVSSMGGGGVIEHLREGIVVDPHDINALADAIKTMVNDRDLRSRMASAAGSRATLYTWDKVARARRDLLFSRLNPQGSFKSEQVFHTMNLVPERIG
jgi:glycosyltransferase involved in cell wall biosynthesis